MLKKSSMTLAVASWLHFAQTIVLADISLLPYIAKEVVLKHMQILFIFYRFIKNNWSN